MSMYLVDENDTLVEFATNEGWKRTADYIIAYAHHASAVVEFVNEGNTENTQEMRADLRTLIQRDPPRNILGVLRNMRRFLKDGPGIVILSNGVVSNEFDTSEDD